MKLPVPSWVSDPLYKGGVEDERRRIRDAVDARIRSLERQEVAYKEKGSHEAALVLHERVYTLREVLALLDETTEPPKQATRGDDA